MVYYSKRDWWIGLLLLGVPVLSWLIVGLQAPLLVHIIYGILFLFLSWIYFGTRYKVEENYLKIYCGPMCKTVDIHKLKAIRKTRNPLSAPACSLDRIEIRGKKIYTLLSPENREEFIEKLLEVNPNITYNS